MLKQEGRQVCLAVACLLLVAMVAVPAQASLQQEEQWACQLMLDGPPGLPVPLADYTTFLGAMAGRGDGCEVDLSDSPNPPLPPEGDYVDAYWDHTGIVGCPPEMQKLAQDWRSPILPGSTKEWEELKVTGTVAGTYTLSWVLGAGSTDWEPPSYYSFTLTDMGNECASPLTVDLDMRTQSSYSFYFPGGTDNHWCFAITVADTRTQQVQLEMTQPLYSFTYGEMSHVQATARDAASGLPIGCLPDMTFEWDLDGDGEYGESPEEMCDGQDDDCDSCFDGYMFLDVCAGTYSVRARFTGNDTYLPAMSGSSLHHRAANAARLAAGEEELCLTYSDPGTITVILMDQFGNALRHVEDLPQVWMEIGDPVLLGKGGDVSAEEVEIQAHFPLEIQEGGDVDLIPGTYPVRFTWPGDCHYLPVMLETTLVVEKEILAPQDVPGYPRLAVSSHYWEDVSIAAHRVDNDGEEICHATDAPVLATLSGCSPILGVCTDLETTAGAPDTIATFAAKKAEKMWSVEEVRQASGVMPYKLRYHGSPYYEEKEEEATWTIIPDQMASPLMEASNWRMISVPGYPVDPDPLAVFAGMDIDLKLWKWDSAGKQYVPYDALQPGGFGFVEPMRGYWLYPVSQCSYSYPGYLKKAIQDGDAALQGQLNWHLIGNPKVQPMTIGQVMIRESPTGMEKEYEEAVAAGWISNPLYTWGGQQCQNGYCTVGMMPWDQSQLDAYQGAWLFSFFDIYIEVSTD